MIVKLLTEHHLEFQSIGSSESTHVKMPHCWKSHATAQLILDYLLLLVICYSFYQFFSLRRIAQPISN